MGRARRNLPSAVAAGAKERHRRAQRPQYDRLAPVPEGFVAKPPVPKIKHHSYYEFVENKEKRKKLEFQITTKKTPPPGFEFVPIGNPQLTTACKELSREKDAMIFIVSGAKGHDATPFTHHVHRIGHHIRQIIVEEAKASIVNLPRHVVAAPDGEPELIPDSQVVYHAQVDAAIRDLFPRIPNTDRQMIIEHAFTRGSSNRSEKPVGLCEDITLARRVQLAVLAHIRHTHTRYDELLKETSWSNARKVVEALCLDILVKWRGDEETGRDQLDEILREVVVISDSEDEDLEEESTNDTSVEDLGNGREVSMPDYRQAQGPHQPGVVRRESPRSTSRIIRALTSARPNQGSTKETNRDRTAEKKAQRGFKRYQAWTDAIRRNRDETPQPPHSLDLAVSHRSHQQHGSVAAPHEMPSGFYHNPDSSRDPGRTSSLNSHVPQRRPASWDPSPHPSQHTSLGPREKVMSVAHDQRQSTSASRQPASPVANHFQDMLVRSIEPVSPHVQPPFARTLQPRSPDPMEPRSQPASMQHRPGLVSHPGERICIEDRPYLSRGAVDNRTSQKDSWLGVFSNEEPSQLSNSRDRNHLHSIHGGMSIASPLSYSTARFYEPDSLQNRRIVVNAPRPGERSNPILMEDRGGFYERINPRPEDAIRVHPQGAQFIEPLPPSLKTRRTLEPHRVVSWEEGSRILKESQGTPGVEVIPISCPHARFPTTRSHASHGSLDPPVYDRRAGGEPHQGYREVLDSDSRSVPGAEYFVPSPHHYWFVEQCSGRPIAPQQQRGFANPQYLNQRPLAMDERRHDTQESRPQPRTLQNVIVLD